MNTQISKYLFHVHGMHCNACVLTIENELKDLPDIKEAKSSLGNHSVEVMGYFGDKPVQEIIKDL